MFRPKQTPSPQTFQTLRPDLNFLYLDVTDYGSAFFSNRRRIKRVQCRGGPVVCLMSKNSNPWTDHLNPEQAEAAQHKDGPLLILAGAGSGKTTVLVSRTGHLIDRYKVNPSRICVLTFTNKAANELKSRVSHKIGKSAKKVWAGTFHGFGLQLLKTHHKEVDLPRSFGVIDQSDGTAILKELLTSHKAYEKERFSVERLQQKIDLLRKTKNPNALDDTIESAMAEILTPKYERRLKQLAVVDFEGLLLEPLRLIQTNEKVREIIQSRFDYLMVDEFQDTNAIQMKLVDQLVQPHHNIAVVGDDDQSIYGWRGAEVENILNFPKRYQDCKVVRLERNYRSSSSILELANSVVTSNSIAMTKPYALEQIVKENSPKCFLLKTKTPKPKRWFARFITWSPKNTPIRTWRFFIAVIRRVVLLKAN